MQRILKFVQEYRWFSLAVVSAIAGLALQLLGHESAANIVIAVISIVQTLPLIWGMWQDFRNGNYGIDILAITAIVASVWLHQYWAALVVVLMLTGGESLEDFAEHRAKSELDALLKRAPQMAHVIRHRKIVDVKVSALRVGDKIIIKPGELVPVDAVILDGMASFDEASLTGESLPQSKQTGDTIISGSINLDGAITARASSSAEDSQYQQIVKLVKSAAASKAPFVRLANRYALPFTLTAYSIGIMMWVLSGQAIRFLEVIIVATPCPLILAAPIALISGMARASKFGIIVKNGAALEKLAEAQTIAFDKTGTLTSGTLQLDTVIAYGNFTKNDVLAAAASLEENSNHVLAQAIVNGARARKLKYNKAKHVQEISGRGLKAHLKGQEILVGRFSLVEDAGVKMPARFKAASIKQTAAYVAIDGQLAGIITLKDELRTESKSTIASLLALGIKQTLLITGDNHSVAKKIAKSLGITEVYAETMPADKLRIVESIEDRPVAFVGDGVNDAPVLTASDIGIALGARGSTAASESADMVIMLDDLSRVAVAVQVAKGTFGIAKQSIMIGIALSLLMMLAFATGRFSPLLGAALQEIVDVVVIFNALRAHLIKVTV